MMPPLAILAVLSAVVAILCRSTADAWMRQPQIAFAPRELQQRSSSLTIIRGGASLTQQAGEAETTEDEDEEESEDDEEEVEELINSLEEEEEGESEQEEDDVDAKLAAATLLKTSKSKLKQEATKMASLKEVVNTKMAETKPVPVQKKRNVMKLLRVPYIIRACCNPFTIFSMSKAYWASLFNLDYLKAAEPSQDLRSALEQKAKRDGPSSPKGKRKMKRGQAKTLSDLPALST